jgi:hypothetical protein
MRLGINLVGIPEIELASVLEDAHAVTDAFCNMPLTPVPGNFLGLSLVDEEHRFRYPDSHWDRGSRRVYLRHRPIRTVSSFKLKVGQNAVASIPVASVVVNHVEHWIEPTTTVLNNSSGLFGIAGWIVPLGGLTSPMALVSYESGWSLPAASQRLYPIATDSLTYQGPHGWWIESSDEEPIVVADNGTEVDSDDYTIDLDSGRVVFSDGYSVMGTIRASYSHKLPLEIERAQGYIAADLLGSSNLKRKGFVSGIKSLKAGDISINRDIPSLKVDLAESVPEAARLLYGFRHWSMA